MTARTTATTLAQQTSQADPLAVVIPVAALIIVVVGAGLIVMHLRGRMLRKQTDASATGSWLDELRAMHRRGEVSDEEFEAARASLLAKISGSPVPRKPAPTSARIAQPGFDLTGAPLPTPASDPPPDAGPSTPPHNRP